MTEEFEMSQKRELSRIMTAARNNQTTDVQLSPAAQTAFDRVKAVHAERVRAYKKKADAERNGDIPALVAARGECAACDELMASTEKELTAAHHQMSLALDRKEGAFQALRGLISEAESAYARDRKTLARARELSIEAENLTAATKKTPQRLAQRFEALLRQSNLTEAEAREGLKERGHDPELLPSLQ